MWLRRCIKSLISPYLYQYLPFYKNNSYSNKCKVILHLVINEVEHVFMYLLVLFLETCLFSFSIHFLIGLLYFDLFCYQVI